MHDEKVKAEKGTKGERIQASLGLSIDSPMSIWHTDLDALGIGGGGGGGTGSEGGVPTRGGPQPKTAPLEYIATCDAVSHALDVVGAVDDGRWFGSFHERYDDALAQAQQHEDGLAYVAFYVGTVMVGPVVQH